MRQTIEPGRPEQAQQCLDAVSSEKRDVVYEHPDVRASRLRIAEADSAARLRIAEADSAALRRQREREHWLRIGENAARRLGGVLVLVAAFLIAIGAIQTPPEIRPIAGAALFYGAVRAMRPAPTDRKPSSEGEA